MAENFNAHPAILELTRIFGSDFLLGPPLSEKSLKVVGHLFTAAEAEVARHLPFYRPKPAEKIAKKAGRPVAEVKPLLEAMSAKRVILKLGEGYALIPLIPGIFEYSLWNGVDTEWHREFAYLINDLYATGFPRKYNETGKVPIIRTIPVQSRLQPKSKLIDPGLLSAMIDQSDDFALLKVCQCRQAMRFTGKPCKRSAPEDGCLVFGSFAKSMVERGDGNPVTREQMREIAGERWDKKLVFWATNVKPGNPNAICTCCDCCCHFLESVNHYGGMASITPPRVLASFDASLCDHCGKCVKACNTHAHTLENKKHSFNPANCLGCGLCVETCKPAAIKMLDNPAYRTPFSGYKSLVLKAVTFITWKKLVQKVAG